MRFSNISSHSQSCSVLSNPTRGACSKYHKILSTLFESIDAAVVSGPTVSPWNPWLRICIHRFLQDRDRVFRQSSEAAIRLCRIRNLAILSLLGARRADSASYTEVSQHFCHIHRRGSWSRCGKENLVYRLFLGYWTTLSADPWTPKICIVICIVIVKLMKARRGSSPIVVLFWQSSSDPVQNAVHWICRWFF